MNALGYTISPEQIAAIVLQLVIVLMSVVVHEVCHGLAAYRLGDPTAKASGRLTLNPVKHLDPFGSVILPLIMAAFSGPVLAYAKPVPYNPSYFKHRKRDELLVSLAGPGSNLVLGMIGGAIMWGVSSIAAGSPLVVDAYNSPADARSTALYWVYLFGYELAWINFVLFFFNILPVPPLDGATIIATFVPERYMGVFYTIKQYSMLILIVVVFVLPMVLNFDPFGWYLSTCAGGLADLVSPSLPVVRATSALSSVAGHGTLV